MTKKPSWMWEEDIEQLSKLIASLLVIVRHGDYSNGVVSPEGWDEGAYKTGQVLREIEDEAKDVGVYTDANTLMDVEEYYG